MLAQANILGDEPLPTPQDLGMGRKARSLGHAERQLKDGRWIRSEGTRTSDGGFVFFVSDFTEIKQREEDSHRAKMAAEAASAAKSRFLANMSHELRTPLNAIIGFSEIIAAGLFGPVGNARYLEYATDITRSGRHLLDVINSVLEISRSEAGKQQFNAESVDLRYLLRDGSRMMRRAMRGGWPHLRARRQRRAGDGLWREGEAAPDLPQPALQRDQVHRRGRLDRCA